MFIKFLLFYFFCNLVLLGSVITLGSFFFKQNQNLESVILANQKDLKLLNTELLLLKQQNLHLKEELEAKNIFIKSLNEQDIFFEHTIFMVKIITFIILVLLTSYFFYSFTMGSFSIYNILLGKVITLINTIKFQLIGLFGIGKLKTISFLDIAGNHFVIGLANNDTSINISVEIMGTSEYLSITDFITYVRSDIKILNEVIQNLSGTLIELRSQLSLKDNLFLDCFYGRICL